MSMQKVQSELSFHNTKLLEADGIEVADGRVDLEKYQWELLDTMYRN